MRSDNPLFFCLLRDGAPRVVTVQYSQGELCLIKTLSHCTEVEFVTCFVKTSPRRTKIFGPSGVRFNQVLLYRDVCEICVSSVPMCVSGCY